MTPAQVWVLTLQCVHASAIVTACDSIRDGGELSGEVSAVMAEATMALGKASLALVDAGASVLDAARAVIRERGGR